MLISIKLNSDTDTNNIFIFKINFILKCFNMNCFCCQNIIQPKQTVLLLCQCDLILCQNCAKQQLINNSLTYRSCIHCPSCNLEIKNEYGIKTGSNEAEEKENIIVRKGFALTGTEHSEQGTINSFNKLLACFNKLNILLNPVYKPIHREEPFDREVSTLRRKINYNDSECSTLRRKITVLMLTICPTLTDPIQCIQFTNNVFLEIYLFESNNIDERNHIVLECSICKTIPYNNSSIQLTCQCKYIMCRTCTIHNICYQKETIYDGIVCALCRSSSYGSIQNIDYINNIIDIYYNSIINYLSVHVIPVTLNKKNHENNENKKEFMIYILKWLYCLTNMGSNNISHIENMSFNQIKLEIARLEEYRLNNNGIINTYNIYKEYNNSNTTSGSSNSSDNIIYGHIPLGFLLLLNIKKNYFYEKLKKKLNIQQQQQGCAEHNIIITSPVQQEQQQKAVEHKLDMLLLNYNNPNNTTNNTSSSSSSSSSTTTTINNTTSNTSTNTTATNKYTIFEQLLLIAMFLQRDSANIKNTRKFSSIDELIIILKEYFNSPIQVFQSYFTIEKSNTTSSSSASEKVNKLLPIVKKYTQKEISRMILLFKTDGLLQYYYEFNKV